MSRPPILSLPPLHVVPEGHMAVTLASWPSRRRSVRDKRQMLFFLPPRLISSKTRSHRPPMTWQKHPAVPPSAAAGVSKSLLGDSLSLEGGRHLRFDC